MKSILNEIGGALTFSRSASRPGARTQPIGQQVVPSAPQVPPHRFNTKAEFDNVLPHCKSMHGFQTEVFNILRNGGDVYVPAAPGGGKTLPYQCHWTKNILGIDTMNTSPKSWGQYAEKIYKIFVRPEECDKILILVPTRSLADQTYQEFKVIYAQIIENILNAFLELYFMQPVLPTTPNQMADTNIATYREILDTIRPGMYDKFRERNNLRTQLDEWINNPNQYSDSQVNDLRDRIDNLDSIMQQDAVAGVKKIVDGERTSKALIAIRHGLQDKGDPKTAPVTIAIYESAERIIKDLRDKLKLVVCDEAHLAQDKEIRDNSRSTNIAFALYTVIGTINQNTSLCFLSGTENPASAQNFADYLKVCYRRNVKVINVPGTVGNKSNVSVFIDDSIANDDELIRIMKNSSTRNNVIIIFSTKKIDELAARVVQGSAKRSLRNLPSQYDFRDLPSKQRFSLDRRTSRFSTAKNVASQATAIEATGIHSERQRGYVQAGFGVIYRVKDNDRDKKEKSRDNQIVAALFKKGQIRTLLATDAIGIGVNIDVKTMYIPTVEKFQGTGFKPMHAAELSQLLNRTGRGAFMFSRVVTTTKHASAISNALSMTPEGFPMGVNIEKIPKELCYLRNAFADFWTSQFSQRTRYEIVRQNRPQNRPQNTIYL